MRAIRIILFMLNIATYLSAQQATSSPYSMFGLGEYANGLHGQNSAMGGVAYGIQHPWVINTENPAGLIGLDKHKLYLEASVFLKNEDYKSGNETNHAVTGNCSAFIIAGRISSRWAMAVGLTPYTSVGYVFKDKQPLEGTPGSFVHSTYQGEGGISRMLISNSIGLSKNLSVGINLGYLFGSSTLKEIQNIMAVENEMFSRAFHADLGIQYKQKINGHTQLVAGGVFGFKHKVDITNTIKVKTTSDPVDVTDEKTNQYIPRFMGLGGAIIHKKVTYAMDYTFKEYSSLQSTNNRVKFRNTHEIKAGISYNPSTFINSGLWKRSDYKAGITLSNPNYTINSKSGLAYRASIGMSIPFANAQLSTAVFYDRMKIGNGLLEKNILGITFTCTFAERLYRAKLK